MSEADSEARHFEDEYQDGDRELEPTLVREGREETYRFRLEDARTGWDMNLTPAECRVEITFVDGEFERCEYRFNSPYDRRRWKALAAIHEKIEELDAPRDPDTPSDEEES